MALGEAAKGAARGFRSGFFGDTGEMQDARKAESEMLAQRSEVMKLELNDRLGIQDDKRRKAMGMDIRQAGYFLSQNKPQEALRLLENRKQFLKKGGKSNSKQTEDFINKIKSGDMSVLQDMAVAENAFVLARDLEPVNQSQVKLLGMASQPEIIDASKMTKSGQILREGPEGVVATDVIGLNQPVDMKTLKNQLDKEETTFKRAKSIRSEIDNLSKEFVKVEDAYGRIEVSAKDPSAAGDLALIFNYMKMLDPGSTVREGEFATAANAGAIDDRVYNVYNRLMSGERLAPKQRTDFVGRAKGLFGDAKGKNTKRVNQRLKLGERYNLTRADILGEEIAEAVEAKAPAIAGPATDELSDEELLQKYGGS